jgi:large subunit ribosomal protein L6
MSRIAKAPIRIATGVQVEIAGQEVKVKGSKGVLGWTVHPLVTIAQEDGEIRVAPTDEGNKQAWAQAGTTRALVANMVTGCATGFERKLNLVGVGYRAQAQGRNLSLSLGFSHPVSFPVPEGIEIATPTPTEIVVSGADKQRVGQVAAEIRSVRPPEPYKGKGVRYSDEQVLRKEAKKKK